jgi:hypothetical protein
MPIRRASGREIAHSIVRDHGGADMFIVKVAWDARIQQFRLMDQKLANMFEDGDMYLLVVDFLPHDSDSDEQFIDLDRADMGHA